MLLVFIVLVFVVDLKFVNIYFDRIVWILVRCSHDLFKYLYFFIDHVKLVHISILFFQKMI